MTDAPDWARHVERARARLHDVPVTPLLPCDALGELVGAPAALKAECLQRTGSFKYRPALNGVRALDAEQRRRGVVTSSSGNFAAAVARAARDEGVAATIVMTPSTDDYKIERTRKLGAEVVICENRYDARQETVDDIRERTGAVELHPHSSIETVAGDATVGLEILAAAPGTGTIVAPASGGGLLGGCALAVHLAGSSARVHGVQPDGNPALVRSWERGTRVRTDRVGTIADGLQAAMPGEHGFALARTHVHGAATVPDAAIVAAMRFCFEHAKLVVEPAGATALAALLSGRIEVTGPVVVVISGGNVAPERHARLLTLGDEVTASD